MKAEIAVSNVKDPLNGRFVPSRDTHCELIKVGVAQFARRVVDLVIKRDGGPYIRVRMDPEGAREVWQDMKRTADRAAAKAPSGAFHPFLVARVWFNTVEGAIHAEVLGGYDTEEQANMARDKTEEEAPATGVMYFVIPGRVL